MPLIAFLVQKGYEAIEEGTCKYLSITLYSYVIDRCSKIYSNVKANPTFYKITKKKDVEEFKTDPYLATVLNCAFWVFYGIGLVFEFVYLTIFIVYVKKAGRKKHLHGTTKRSLIVGILCDMFNIAMYVSPLTVMAMVIKTKSVKYMPFWLSVAKFLNGCCWTTYFIFYK
ncbi:hypothetical protein P8452_01093 [Trifolium repens]|nr:hypothetical protein P8452_01093 [Trifolium repens]